MQITTLIQRQDLCHQPRSKHRIEPRHNAGMQRTAILGAQRDTFIVSRIGRRFTTLPLTQCHPRAAKDL